MFRIPWVFVLYYGKLRKIDRVRMMGAQGKFYLQKLIHVI